MTSFDLVLIPNDCVLASEPLNDTNNALLIVLFYLEVLVTIEVEPVVLLVMSLVVVCIVLIDLVGPPWNGNRVLLGLRLMKPILYLVQENLTLKIRTSLPSSSPPFSVRYLLSLSSPW